MFYTGMLAGAAYGGLMSQEGGWRGALKGAAIGGAAGRYGMRALQKARLPSMAGQGMMQRSIAGARSAGRLAMHDINKFIPERMMSPGSSATIASNAKGSVRSTKATSYLFRKRR